MIRRLQIEPPKLALPSDKSNKSEDPTAKESIAAEFKKLLERARGGLAGARDEVAALGFALSQAVSTVKAERVEVQGEKTVDDTAICDEGGQQGEVQLQDSGPKTDTGTTQDNSRRVEHERGQTDTGDGETEVTTDGPYVDDGGVELEQEGGPISLEEEILYTDLAEFEIEEEVEVDDNQLGAELFVSQTIQADTRHVEVAETDDSIEFVKDSGGKTLAQSGEEEDVEDDYFLDEFVDDDVASQNGLVNSLRNNVKFGGNRTKQVDAGGERDLLVERLVSGTEDAQGDGQGWGVRDDGFARALGMASDLRPGSDRDVHGMMARRDDGNSSRFSSMEVPFLMKEPNQELSIQLSLLRQAFDALKAQAQGQGEMRQKSGPTTVSGVGATSEPRSAQPDSAPRGVKYLDRAAAQRMMERIESALKEAARSRDGKTISLRLEPAQLGQVKCDVSLRDGQLHAKITPQNQEVLQALRDHAHELQTALRRLGLNVDRVTVQVSSDTFSSAFANTSGLLDGKTYQDGGNNMPGKDSQTPEKTLGNEFADVSKAGVPDAGIASVDHWIA